MVSTHTSLYYHIIFSIKNRLPLLTEDIRQRVYDYIGGIIRSRQGVLIAAGGTVDHIHLCPSFHQTHTLADDIRDLKAGSSSWIKTLSPQFAHFSWQQGYGAFTIGYPELSQVKAYLAGQASHHRTATFKEEFLDFLHRYAIDYDERYIWN